MKHWLLTYLFFLFFTNQLLAQEDVKIGGIIRDSSGTPIELATIRIEGSTIGTISNLKGKYSLKFKSRDSITIIYSMIGFQPRKKKLIKPRGNISINVVLLKSEYELSEIRVSEYRRQSSTNQRLNTFSSHLSPDASGGSIEAMLITQPGISNNNELSSQYNVRGGSFDENMIYVNGIEIYRPLLIHSVEQEGLSFLNPAMIENIEFSTGGYEARYGDKMSSVLDISYKKPKQFEGNISASLLGASAYVGMSKKKFSWINGLRYKTHQYLLGTLDTKGEYRPNFIDYQTFFHWKPSKRVEVGIIGNISNSQFHFKPKDRYTRFGTLNDIREFKVYFEGEEKDLFSTFLSAGHVTYSPNKSHHLSIQASAFRTQERETYDIVGQYWLKATTQEKNTEDNGISNIGTYMEHARNRLNAEVQIYSVSGRHQLKRHNIMWGYEIRKEKIKERMREWEMIDSAGYSLPQSPESARLSYVLHSRNQINSTRHIFYIQNTYKAKTSLGLFTLITGLRGNYWNWNKEFIFSPRISLSLIPTFNERFTLRLATGIYYQAPFYKELKETFITNGISSISLNKNIQSQRAIHIVGGGDYDFKAFNRPFRFTIETYYKLLNNLIPYNIDNVRINYYGKNLSKGYAVGIDMRLFGEFVPGTDSWLSFSLMKTEEKVNDRWLPRPTDQRYRLSLFFTDYFPGTKKWQMNLKATLAGGLPFGPPHNEHNRNTFRTPPYRRVDIGMSRCLIDGTNHHSGYIKSLWIGVDILNLLNIKNVNSYYWITNGNSQFAVPNYLSTRQFNIRLLLDF